MLFTKEWPNWFIYMERSAIGFVKAGKVTLAHQDTEWLTYVHIVSLNFDKRNNKAVNCLILVDVIYF